MLENNIFLSFLHSQYRVTQLMSVILASIGIPLIFQEFTYEGECQVGLGVTFQFLLTLES